MEGQNNEVLAKAGGKRGRRVNSYMGAALDILKRVYMVLQLGYRC